MLQIQTTNLASDQQSRLHGDFLANEQAYLQMRSQLLAQYRGKWVAVHDGKILAYGDKLIDVLESAASSGGHPYIALVGAEDNAVFRVCRAEFAYDQAYQPFPLPPVSATFFNHVETHSRQLGDVIPDTGADVSVLPDTDCAAIDLFTSPYMTAMAGGVLGATVTTLLYQAKIEIDGHRYTALIQPIPARTERIIGRDVLNQQRVLFDGPAGQVVINP